MLTFRRRVGEDTSPPPSPPSSYSGSPSIGCPRWRRWRRIWCVRPVDTVARRTLAARRRVGGERSQCRVRRLAVGVAVAARRAIGGGDADWRTRVGGPAGRTSTPRTRATYALETAPSWSSDTPVRARARRSAQAAARPTCADQCGGRRGGRPCRLSEVAAGPAARPAGFRRPYSAGIGRRGAPLTRRLAERDKAVASWRMASGVSGTLGSSRMTTCSSLSPCAKISAPVAARPFSRRRFDAAQNDAVVLHTGRETRPPSRRRRAGRPSGPWRAR